MLRKTFNRIFIVIHGRIYKRGASGKKVGKPLDELEAVRQLSEVDASFGAMALPERSSTLHELLLENQESTTGDIVLEAVDIAAIPLLKAFLWFSDGQTIQTYFYPGYLKRLLEGHANPEGAPRELQLASGAPDGLATALAADAHLWNLAVAYYADLVFQNPEMTPRKVLESNRRIYHTLRGYLTASFPLWLSDGTFRLNERPKTISNLPREWCFLRYRIDKVRAQAPSAGATPNWDQWLCKLGTESFRQVFRAWLFSVFVADNTGRQILWIEDAGGGGKGTIAGVIQKYMRYVGCGAMDSHMLTDGFGAASAYGKRLLIHPDNKNPRLLSSGLIHQITGGDEVRVNQKFQQAFTAKMEAKVLVLANCKPEVDLHLLHESSRIIYLKLDPNAEGADKSHRVEAAGGVQLVGDASFPARLLSEMTDFLAKCSIDYDLMCPKGSNIRLPEEVVEAAHVSCSSTEMDHFDHFAEEGLLFGPEFYLPRWQLQDIVRGMKAPQQGFTLSNFKKYLEARGCREGRLSDKGRTKVYYGVTEKDRPLRIGEEVGSMYGDTRDPNNLPF